MFEYAQFVIRNPAYVVRNMRNQSSVRKAMLSFKEGHPECAYCGRSKKLDVHHKVPVSVSPDIAGRPSNMIMLCRKPACHQIIGHDGDFGNRYVINVQELCNSARIAKTIKYTDEEGT